MPRTVSTSLTFPEQLYQLGRPANFVLPFLLLVVGYALGGGSLTAPDVSLYILATALFVIHTATTIANDLADQDVDRANDAQTVITSGSKRTAHQFALAVVGLIVVALCLLLLTPLLVQIVLWSIIVLGFFYNFRPLQLSRRPISSILTLGLTYAGLPLIAGYLLHHDTLPISVTLLAICWATSRISLSILKDFKDKKGDAKHHKHTFLLRYSTTPTLITSLITGVIGTAGVGFLLAEYITATVQPLFWIYTCVMVAIVLWQRIYLLRQPKQADTLFHRYLLWQVAIDGGFLVWLTLF